MLLGASTEDGKGNITAYAGIRDNQKVTASRSRLFRLLPEPDNKRRRARALVQLRRFGDELPRLLLYAEWHHSRSTRRRAIPSARSTRHGPLQLRSAEPLPAAGSSLQPRCDGSLRVGPRRGRLHAAHVHRLFVDCTDRAGWKLLQLQFRQLRQPIPLSAATGLVGCTRGGHSLRSSQAFCISRAATSKAAVASSHSKIVRSARWSVVRGDITPAWNYDASVQYSRLVADIRR